MKKSAKKVVTNVKASPKKTVNNKSKDKPAGRCAKASKNRDGKPTDFQRKILKERGYTKPVKTYRDAENALRRLARAAKKPIAKAKPSKKAAANNPCACKRSKAISGNPVGKVVAVALIIKGVKKSGGRA